MKYFICSIVVSASLLFGSSCSSLHRIEGQITDIKKGFEGDVAEADRLLLEGEITKEERDALVDQSRKLRSAELGRVAKDAPLILSEESASIKSDLRGGLFELAQLALLLLLGGGSVGAGAVAAKGLMKR